MIRFIHMLSQNTILRYAILFGTLAFCFKISEFYSLHAHYFDFYWKDHSAWNVAQGNGPYLSMEKISFFGHHFYPIFYIIGFFYHFIESPIWLFLTHALLFAFMSYPIFKLGHHYFGKKGLLFTFFYMIAYYSMREAFFEDLHGELVFLPLISWSLYFIHTKQDKAAIFCTLAMVLAKENAAAIIIPIGLFYAIFRKQYKIGIGLILFSLLYSVWVLKIFIPSFNPHSEYKFIERYATIGGSFSDILINAIRAPWLILKQLFSLQTLAYTFGLLLPFGFIIIKSPYILIAIGIFLQNVLADIPFMMSDITTHYTLPLIPIFFIAFIIQLHQLKSTYSKEKWERFKKRMTIVVIFCVTLNCLLFTFIQLRNFFVFNPHTQSAREAMTLIPKHAALSASSRLLPHVHYRPNIHFFPKIPERQDARRYYDSAYIFVEGLDPIIPRDMLAEDFVKQQWSQGHYFTVINMLIVGEHAPRFSNSAYVQHFDQLFINPDLELIYDKNNIFLFKRKFHHDYSQ